MRRNIGRLPDVLEHELHELVSEISGARDQILDMVVHGEQDKAVADEMYRQVALADYHAISLLWLFGAIGGDAPKHP